METPKRILPLALGALLALASCTTKVSKPMEPFIDEVALAINQGGQADLETFSWIREPKTYKLDHQTLSLTTEPQTDLWMRTFYPMEVVNAPIYYLETELEAFNLTMKTDFSSAQKANDQCGVCVYLDDENWLKASVEVGDENENQLGAVVNTDGYSDWSTNPIEKSVTKMWYLLTRKGLDFQVSYSLDGEKYNVLRACHLKDATSRIKVGLYACSPSKDGSFTAHFSNLRFTK